MIVLTIHTDGSLRPMGNGKLVPTAVLVIACAFVLKSSSLLAQQQQGGLWPAKGKVSLISLIARPERFDGIRVRTAGVAVIQMEQYMLYLGPYDADEGIENNGVWLALDHDQISRWRGLNRRLVEVEGVFQIPSKGSYGSCPNGALTKISQIRTITLQ